MAPVLWTLLSVGMAQPCCKQRGGTLDASPCSGCSLSPLSLGCICEIKQQLKHFQRIIKYCFDTRLLTLIMTIISLTPSPAVNQTFTPSLDLKEASWQRERQKVQHWLQWGSAYLQYILDSLIDKFNIYCIQKCMSRKDLTPERTTMWETLLESSKSLQGNLKGYQL